METKDIFNFIIETAKKAAKNIHIEYNETLNYPNTSKLIIPNYRESDNKKPKKRISEQEFRFAFTAVLESKFNDLDIYYSVETPTEFEYSFSGRGSRSASTDLTLYDSEKIEKLCNIEFKAHIPEQQAIDKDIEKLVTEDVLGCWCHIIEKSDSGTAKSLFGKFREAFKKYNTMNKELMVLIYIIDKNEIVRRIIEPNELQNTERVFPGEIINCNLPNEWIKSSALARVGCADNRKRTNMDSIFQRNDNWIPFYNGMTAWSSA